MVNYFGAMLDMSRNAVMKPDEVKAYAATLKKLGYNMIQLYTEETYEVTDEPYFGYLRGRYSQEELRDIVAYCDSIGMEVIPCIQTLAHLNSIFRWEAYSKTVNDCGDILLIDEPRTYELIENMVKSIRSCFTSKRIHIGFDEAHMVGLGKYRTKHGLQNRFETVRRHLERVLEIAQKYDFQPMMWSDMLFRLARPDGGYYTKNDISKEAITAFCPKDVDLVYWDYYHNELDMFDKMIESHQKSGNNIWFCGGAWCWSGWAPHNKWSLESMKQAMKSCHSHGITNIFMALWGDNGKECSFYSVLPSLYAIRRFYDGVEDMELIKREFAEITGEDFDAMMRLDLPNDISDNRKYDANPSKYMLYSDPFLGFLDSALVPDAPAKYAEYSKVLANDAKSSKRYGYIFDCLAKLCDVLSLKYDLGARTRNAYTAKDTDALGALVDDYTAVISRVEAFYVSFRALWFRENKPHGFDVQDQRIGGLLLRLKSCRERITDFNDGKLDSIPELEETILDFENGGVAVREFSFKYNGWSRNVTVNPI
ncbi:MAG: beta-N-acetylhexosaminidase [Clostridia bacterium]|nr:beta-N-acetylhexosaminidase [Clostridia bacterium]